MVCAKAMNAVTQTLIYNEDAVGADLVPRSHYLAISPGLGETPILFFYDEHAGEFALIHIYLGEPRNVVARPFAKASSEIPRKDRRGVER
ncbi:hypothetical protein HPB48_011287 [Haemaphysalis longicornis]|uniref:Uncharacterized protein n=1 Tax=Haemaphysalis longicornis TaxID=44386 RepID=A0A9J6GZS9_HAELO|nr:hypothetical protein HPB48_011287 [Haemaphysalis longicornis]